MNILPNSMYDYRHENPKAKQISVCGCCGWGIYNGDVYYEVDGKNICEDCIKDYKKEREAKKSE